MTARKEYRNRHMRRAGEYALAGPASYRPSTDDQAWFDLASRVGNQLLPDAAEQRDLDHQILKARWEARKMDVFGGWHFPLWWTAQVRGKRGALRVLLERRLFESIKGVWLWFEKWPEIRIRFNAETGRFEQIRQGDSGTTVINDATRDDVIVIGGAA